MFTSFFLEVTPNPCARIEGPIRVVLFLSQRADRLGAAAPLARELLVGLD